MTQSYDDLYGARINIAHESNLVVLLVGASLVNADGVNPQQTAGVGLPKSSHSLFRILGHRERLSAAQDSSVRKLPTQT